MKLTIVYQRDGAPAPHHGASPQAVSLAGEFASVQDARELAVVEAQSTLAAWCVAFEIRDVHHTVLSRWEKPKIGADADAEAIGPGAKRAAGRG